MPDRVDALLLNLCGPVFERVDSTQEHARRLAEAGAPEGTVVRALEQTAGRGRGAHTWHSAPGLGLWVSVILRPRVETRYWPGLTSLLALGAARLLEPLGPDAWRAWIKWPNDLFGARGKIGGILAETAGGALVLGLGINVAHAAEDFPRELRGAASSLCMEGFVPLPEPGALLAGLNEGLTDLYSRYQNGDRAFLSEGLEQRFFLRDRRVRLSGGAESHVVEGIARGVGEQGELILETRDGECRVWSGELLSVEPRGEDG